MLAQLVRGALCTELAALVVSAQICCRVMAELGSPLKVE
jgi:hypothetical protein